MEIAPKSFYHLYNRTNNQELLFRSDENYIYFLSQFRKRCYSFVDTIAYCLMPTHFHWLVYVKTEDTDLLKRKIGDWQSGYTKALNKQLSRHGSLFQDHAKTRAIQNDEDLLTVATYIHQNPVRANLVDKLENWAWSSYPDYIGLRNGSLPVKNYLAVYFKTPEEFRMFSESILQNIDKKYWIG